MFHRFFGLHSFSQTAQFAYNGISFHRIFLVLLLFFETGSRFLVFNSFPPDCFQKLLLTIIMIMIMIIICMSPTYIPQSIKLSPIVSALIIIIIIIMIIWIIFR